MSFLKGSQPAPEPGNFHFSKQEKNSSQLPPGLPSSPPRPFSSQNPTYFTTRACPGAAPHVLGGGAWKGRAPQARPAAGHTEQPALPASGRAQLHGRDWRTAPGLQPGSSTAPEGEAWRSRWQLEVQGRGCPTALGVSRGGAGSRSGKDKLHFLHLSAPKPCV